MIDQKGCILIPAYNEEVHIVSVIEAARKYLPVLVVDDGSTDQTAEEASEVGATVFIQVPNQGKGAALRRGFREAINKGYQYIITMDADGQHDPQEIPTFIRSFQQTGSDLIIGFRDFKKMPFVRRLANSSGSVAFSWAIRQKILDNQSGYRLMSKRLIEKVLNSKEQGFEFEVEVIVTCIQAGYPISWVPIKTIYADEISHIRPVRHFLNFMRVVMQTRQRMRENIKSQSDE